MGSLSPPLDGLPDVLRGGQLTSAVRLAREVTARLAAEPGTVVLPGVLGPWAQGVLLSVRTLHGRVRCNHLRVRPVQPVIVPAPSVLVCYDCFEGRRHGEAPFTACPQCSTRGAALRPVVTQESMFVLRGQLCRSCVLTENDR